MFGFRVFAAEPSWGLALSDLRELGGAGGPLVGD